MSTFVDTSALYATVNATDENHQTSDEVWNRLANGQETLVTSNYVLLETIALIGRRFGSQAVRDFQTQLVPVLRVYWIEESLHERAVAALLTAGERHLSLVDCVSFEVMRQLGLDAAFTFDARIQ